MAPLPCAFLSHAARHFPQPWILCGIRNGVKAKHHVMPQAGEVFRIGSNAVDKFQTSLDSRIAVLFREMCALPQSLWATACRDSEGNNGNKNGDESQRASKIGGGRHFL